jgi:hypothetical protein
MLRSKHFLRSRHQVKGNGGTLCSDNMKKRFFAHTGTGLKKMLLPFMNANVSSGCKRLVRTQAMA